MIDSVGSLGDRRPPSSDADTVLGEGCGKDDAHSISGELVLLRSVYFTARPRTRYPILLEVSCWLYLVGYV